MMVGTHRDAESEACDEPINGDDTDVKESEDTSVSRWPSALTTVKEIFSPVVRAWMAVVRAFSWLLARVTALALFVFAFVPYGLVMRVIGFDPLRRSFDPEVDSYWRGTESTNRDIESFQKQY